jgi:hypothetical protein
VLLGSSGQLTYSATSYTFDVQPTPLPAVCTIAVTAGNPYGTSAQATTTVTYLGAPSDVVVTYYDPATPADAAQMSVTADLDTGVSALNVTVGDGASTLITQADYTPGTLFDASLLVAGTSYTVAVSAYGAATSTNTYSAAAVTVPLVPIQLGAPTVTAIANGPDTVVVSFDLVDTANSYTAQVLDSSGNVLSPAVQAQGTGSPIGIDASTLTTGTSYQVQVRAALVTTAD